MNSKIFEDCLEKLCLHCKNDLKLPKVVFCLDNAKYHRCERRNDLYPVAQEPQYQRPLAAEVIAAKHGYHVLWRPPYHPDLNPIEEAWGLTKQHVALEHGGRDFGKVKDLIYDEFCKANPSWPKLVRRTREREAKYIRDDRILQQLEIENMQLITYISDSGEETEPDDVDDVEDCERYLVELEVGLE